MDEKSDDLGKNLQCSIITEIKLMHVEKKLDILKPIVFNSNLTCEDKKNYKYTFLIKGRKKR